MNHDVWVISLWRCAWYLLVQRYTCVRLCVESVQLDESTLAACALSRVYEHDHVIHKECNAAIRITLPPSLLAPNLA